jgi:TPR repeat protein
MVLQKRGHDDEALGFLEKAVAISQPKQLSPQLEFTMGGNVPYPWAKYGVSKGSTGDQETARRMLEIGALEYGNANAMRVLAGNAKISKDWEKFLKYITLSAMNSDPGACSELGFYYIEQFLQSGGKQEKPKGLFNRFVSDLLPVDFGGFQPRHIGMEWLRIASSYGENKSRLLLAILLREDGNYREGAAWLDEVEDKEFPVVAKQMRRIYTDKDAVFDLARYYKPGRGIAFS